MEVASSDTGKGKTFPLSLQQELNFKIIRLDQGTAPPPSPPDTETLEMLRDASGHRQRASIVTTRVVSFLLAEGLASTGKKRSM